MDYVLVNMIYGYKKGILTRIFRVPFRDRCGENLETVWMKRSYEMDRDNAKRLESWKVKMRLLEKVKQDG